jgi:hypothetical protein
MRNSIETRKRVSCVLFAFHVVFSRCVFTLWFDGNFNVCSDVFAWADGSSHAAGICRVRDDSLPQLKIVSVGLNAMCRKDRCKQKM